MVAALIPLFLAVAVAMMGLGIISPIMPIYIRSFGAGGAALGAVFAAFSLSRFLFAPLLGSLSDRVGRRRIILVGLGLYSIVSLLYAVAQNLWQLSLFRVLHGIGSVMVAPIAQAYVGDLTPPGKEGRITSLFYASMFAGMALGPLAGGYLVEGWSMETPFLAMGALSLLALLGVARWVPQDAAQTRGKSPTQAVKSFRQVLRGPAVLGIIAYFVTRGLWRQSFNSFWPVIADRQGYSESAIGLVLTGYLIGESLFQIPFGCLADRFPRLPQIAMGGLLSPLPLFVIPVVHELWEVAALSIWMGMMSALGRASLLALRTELGRSYGMGTLTGLQNSAFAGGQMLGPIVAGMAFDLFGPTAALYQGALFGLVGTILTLALLVRARPSLQTPTSLRPTKAKRAGPNTRRMNER